ncbi:MAG: beta-lactamase family protein, partial [Proteobacteria bacterium]|nr:beta-lactamase family protein [Pseudomonadota bacterium]
DNNVVGLSIALVDGDKMVWSEGFGWADKENNIPAASNTVYMLGSGTKTMTAVALLRLHEEGVISLDKPARNYLPEFTMAGRFPNQMQNITVRRLLNHHSGIPGDIYTGLFVEKAWNEWGGNLYTDWLLNYLKDDYPSYDPGKVAIYSNVGFVLAGEIGLRWGGSGGGEFDEYMARKLLQPLGMDHTLLRRIKKNMAIGYIKGQRQAAAETNCTAGATGGAFTTVEDMSRFIMMIVSGGQAPDGSRFLVPETVEMMGVGEKSVLDMDTYWQPGLGLDTIDDPTMRYAGRAWAKNGSTGDFNSYMEMLPDKKLGVIVLSNSDTASIFVYAVVREALQNAVKEKFGIAPVSPQLPQYVSIQDADLIAGMYVRKEGYDRIAKNADGTLTWAIGAQTDTPVQRNLEFDGQAYGMDGRTERIIFLNRTLKGKDHFLMLQYGSSGVDKDKHVYGGTVVETLGEKLTLPEVTPAWTARTGKTFIVENLPWNSLNWDGPLFGLVEKDGILMISGNNGKQVISVQNDHLAFTAGLSNRADSGVRVINDGGVEKLLYSGMQGFDISSVAPINIGDSVTDDVSLYKTKWYRFNAAVPGQKVIFTIAGGGQNYRLRLFDNSLMSMKAEGDGGIEVASLPAGNWYLAVSPTPDAAASFTLTVTQ